MKKTVGTFIIFLFLNTLSYSATNFNTRFRKGETLIYDITAFNVKVAEQRTVIRDIVTLSNREVYHIHTEIKTIPSVDKIYHLHNIIDSYVDTGTLLPVLIKTRISEKKWKNETLLYFNRQDKTIYFKDKRGEKTFSYENEPLSLDTLLFYIRDLSPLPNGKVTFFLHNRNKIQKVTCYVKYIPLKSYIPGLKKKVRSIHYRSLNEKGAELWLTHDEYRIPYQFISIKIPVFHYGSISIINNLKYYRKGK
ncbi:MAG: DUF3108 domain-containing protein [bacterium]|nr:DUF3108 domain-containing protein [bacterium]